jgi:hypothetical protein
MALKWASSGMTVVWQWYDSGMTVVSLLFYRYHAPTRHDDQSRPLQPIERIQWDHTHIVSPLVLTVCAQWYRRGVHRISHTESRLNNCESHLITTVSSLYHPCITPVSPLYHPCITPVSPLHHHCVTTVPPLHHHAGSPDVWPRVKRPCPARAPSRCPWHRWPRFQVEKKWNKTVFWKFVFKGAHRVVCVVSCAVCCLLSGESSLLSTICSLLFAACVRIIYEDWLDSYLFSR